jgi:glycosyltransferase involved in cell wall biosynthesis
VARTAGAAADRADVRAAAPADVPGELRRARASSFLIRPTPAKRASSPTKLAESLACGLPVVANRGIGDVDEVLEGESVGVLVESFDADGYGKAARGLAALLADPETPARCRRVAERRFALADAVARYRSLYEEMMADR